MEEITVARKLVKKAIDAGYSVSVYDGEEYPVKRSHDASLIIAALQSTDADTLVLRTMDGHKIGSIYLVWGNGAEDLICDHSDNETINTLVKL